MKKEYKLVRYMYIAMMTIFATVGILLIIAGDYFTAIHHVIFIAICFWNDKLMSLNREQHKIIMKLMDAHKKTYVGLIEYKSDLNKIINNQKKKRENNDR